MTDTIQPAQAAAAPPDDVAPHFAVSPTKLAVMWLCSLGLYGLYWFYRHWQAIRQRERSSIMPAWRAIFSVLFCYALFKRIKASAAEAAVEPGLNTDLAVGYIALSLLWRLPDPYWLVCYGAFAFLLPAQRVANAINARVAPAAPLNDRFTGANYFLIVLGGLMFLLALIGTLMPEGLPEPDAVAPRTKPI